MAPFGIITRVAGNGTAGSAGDDGPAVEAQLNLPAAVAVTADGGFLIADENAHLVREVSAAGTITRVAGTGTAGNSGDDGLAVEAQLNTPAAVAATSDGGFLIADAAAHVVRRVSPEGTITRVAGTGTPGNTGDDGPATEAQLNTPLALALTADGGFLIADIFAHVVRKVSSTGTITRVAGTGTPGDSGDEGPATEAELNLPRAVAVAADGSFLIADALAHVVRSVSADGTITRVAGNGTSGSGGDDGPAADAQLNTPVALAVTAGGGFLIADAFAHVVREVSSAGTITRVAGTGTSGTSGDDGPATEAQLTAPTGLAVTADGGFLIVDFAAHTVRKVAPA